MPGRKLKQDKKWSEVPEWSVTGGWYVKTEANVGRGGSLPPSGEQRTRQWERQGQHFFHLRKNESLQNIFSERNFPTCNHVHKY